MSHTVTVRVEYRNLDALAAAVEALGGTVLGHGQHRLYEGPVTGWGAYLPGWEYPIVLADGQLHFDDYGGRWGDVALLDRLRERYAIEAARRAAQDLGWIVEDQADGSIVIYHPSGGTLTVSPSGEVAASGFVGASCTDAAAPIEQAMGRPGERTLAPEYYQEHARCVLPEEK